MLRHMVESDLPFFSRVRNVSAEWLNDTTEYTIAQTMQWFKSLENGQAYYMICWDSVPVGYFRTRHKDSHNQNIEIGADIDPAFQRRGFAFAGYVKMLEQQFETETMHRVYLSVAGNNLRAIALYRKLLFVHEGTKREHLRRGNIWIDSIQMGMISGEWLNAKTYLRDMANGKLNEITN